MRNAAIWRPSKYVYRDSALRATSDRAFLAPQSRIIADLVARFYGECFCDKAAGDLLDVGCGLVPLYGAYAEYVDSVTAIDWPSSYHGQNCTDVFVDLRTGLPFHSRSFDTVLISDVLEHLPDPELMWSEASRVLRDGGRVIGNTPFLYCLHEEPNDYFRFTRYAIENAVRTSGMTLESISPVGGYVEVLGDMLSKGLAKVPGIGPGMASLTASIVLRFARSTAGQRLTAQTSAKFPLGYFFCAMKAC